MQVVTDCHMLGQTWNADRSETNRNSLASDSQLRAVKPIQQIWFKHTVRVLTRYYSTYVRMAVRDQMFVTTNQFVTQHDHVTVKQFSRDSLLIERYECLRPNHGQDTVPNRTGCMEGIAGNDLLSAKNCTSLYTHILLGIKRKPFTTLWEQQDPARQPLSALVKIVFLLQYSCR